MLENIKWVAISRNQINHVITVMSWILLEIIIVTF